MFHHLQAVQAVVDHTRWLADPTPAPGVVPKEVNTGGIMRFLMGIVAPILLAGLGIAILVRARKGDMSATMNSTAVAVVGIVFLGGAFTLVAIGGWLTDILVK